MRLALLGSQSPYLDTRCGVLPGRNEERSINQWISKSWNNSTVCLSPSLLPFKDDHLVVAENTGNFVHLVSCIAGENEAPSLIVPNAALILHLTRFILKTFHILFSFLP